MLDCRLSAYSAGQERPGYTIDIMYYLPAFDDTTVPTNAWTKYWGHLFGIANYNKQNFTLQMATHLSTNWTSSTVTLMTITKTNLGFLLRFPHKQTIMLSLPLTYSKLLVSWFARRDACDMTLRQPRSSFSLNKFASSSNVFTHNKPVFSQHPTYADNVALHAFACRTPRCCVSCSKQLICPASWRTDRQMPDRCVNPALHSMRAVSITQTIYWKISISI